MERMDSPETIVPDRPDLTSEPPLTGPYPGRIMPVPAHLRLELAPATWCIYEWTEYHGRFPGADRLRVGSQWLMPAIDDIFAITFANQLGLTSITPYCGERQVGDRLHLEVLATKFAGPDASIRFLRAILEDLFSRSTALPFLLSAPTGRRVRDAFRPPNLLFAFHFFRHHHDRLLRAVQAVLGHPHRMLSDEAAMVRVHQVRRIEPEAMRLMLQTARGDVIGAASALTGLERLRPERVLQRLPVETLDTPENRFVVAICRAMLTTVERIRRAPWFGTSAVQDDDRRRIAHVGEHLRMLTTDPRFAGLDLTGPMPSQSRVLQRRDGYRELSQLWQVFQRARQPVFEDLDAAIDLGNIADLYEYWVLFELVDRFSTLTGEEPRWSGLLSEFGQPAHGLAVRFAGAGTLRYNPTYTGYSCIGLRPDYVWQRPDGDLIVMDAKFRMRTPSLETDPDGPTMQGYKTDDIQKMHTYRDALAPVRAAIVLYPGTETMFRTTSGESRPLSLVDVVSGDLDGIGALPVSPIAEEHA